MATGGVDLVLLWHMHQPDYRDRARGEFALPWVYLHAIKDYTDMAAHLERHPRVRAVVNFVPILLEQIEDYALQIERGELRDPLLRLLAAPDLDALATGERRYLLEICARANYGHMIAPFPHYKRLLDLGQMAVAAGDAGCRHLSGAYFSDLVTWYHLAWTGETERRAQPLLAELMAKAEGYTHADRVRLLALIGELVRGLVPRYRALAQAGRIELSTTFYTHPIAPLLIDFAVARAAEPGIALPIAPCYAGGRQRVAVQLERALASHGRCFAASPAGVWPSEGALSEETVAILAQHGVAWTASSASVLARSLERAHHTGPAKERFFYGPYRLEAHPGVAIFFRDDRLSDLIGFEYAKWHGGDAARHFVGELEAIGSAASAAERPLVCVMLDGENAWEHYPYNAYYFFEELYGTLESHPTIRTTTPSAWLREHPQRAGRLSALAAGSWIQGGFSTWIGSAEKNRAWDLLCSAKQSYDLVMARGRLDAARREAADAQLAACEASDWFWWLGDSNPQQAVASFDRLFRANLGNLYAMLGLPAPEELGAPIARGSAAHESGGPMRRACG
jgi:alpha-amylase/alpha-mannosidase (GH57 family)